MQPRINFVTLIVSDLERARRLYLDGLGWPAALTAPGEVAMIHVGDKLVWKQIRVSGLVHIDVIQQHSQVGPARPLLEKVRTIRPRVAS